MKVDHVQMYFFTEIYIPFDMCEGTKLDSYDNIRYNTYNKMNCILK